MRQQWYSVIQNNHAPQSLGTRAYPFFSNYVLKQLPQLLSVSVSGSASYPIATVGSAARATPLEKKNEFFFFLKKKVDVVEEGR